MQDVTTVARERGLWLLRHIASEGSEVEDIELEANMAGTDGADNEAHRNRMAEVASFLGLPFTVGLRDRLRLRPLPAMMRPSRHAMAGVLSEIECSGQIREAASIAAD